MKGQILPLTKVPRDREVELVAITSGRGLRMRLTEMGLNEGVKLRVIHSHLPGPCLIAVDNERLVLGYGMAQKILVKEI